jgi:hypothetical protein
MPGGGAGGVWGGTQQEEGVRSTAQAGESLRSIIAVSERVGAMISEIATAATEQSSTTEHVNGNVNQIARLVKGSAEGAQQSAAACQDLSNLAMDAAQPVGPLPVGSREEREGGSSARDAPNVWKSLPPQGFGGGKLGNFRFGPPDAPG